MATLADIEKSRNQQKYARLFYYGLCLLSIVMLSLVIYLKITGILYYIFPVLTIAFSFLGMIFATKSIRGLEDFLIYYAAKKIQQKSKKFETIYTYPKNMGFNKHNVKQILTTLSEPDKWHIEETSTAFHVMKE